MFIRATTFCIATGFESTPESAAAAPPGFAYSGLIPRFLITSPHFFCSFARRVANFAGELAMMSRPRSSHSFASPGAVRIFFNCSLSRFTIGASYRSGIYYTSDEQKRVAADTIADVDAAGLWPGRVVTEVAPAGPFWLAESEHQDYLERIPNGYTCHFVRPNWKLPVRQKQADTT